MKLIPVLAAAALIALPCSAQTAGHAQVFSSKTIAAQMETLVNTAKASGGSGTKLADYHSHAIELSVRTSSGGAEMHQHFDDIFVVTRGEARLITGGAIVNPKTGPDGETKGPGIRNGKTQTIAKGDIVNVPADTPHQLLIAPGSTYAAIVIKVREP